MVLISRKLGTTIARLALPRRANQDKFLFLFGFLSSHFLSSPFNGQDCHGGWRSSREDDSCYEKFD
jgi:hypothetical protein